jgi:hypothetical protein
VNRFYLSRLSSLGPVLELTLKGGKAAAEDSLNSLLLASHLRHIDQRLYRDYWNQYLDQFGLGHIESINLNSQNILEELHVQTDSKYDDGERISVVMSVFNSETTVDYAIRSILQQTHGNVELLVCDDGSSDQSLDKMLAWKGHPSVRVFKSKENQGTYNIRNSLIQVATGKYLTFQDSDDRAHPERLERQLKALRNSAALAVMGRWVRVRPNGEVVFFRDHNCLRMSVVSLMAETQLFRKLGGYRSVLCAADTELLERLRIWYGPEAVFEIKEPLIFGLWSDRSMTQQHGLEATEDGFRSQARRDYAEIATRQRLLGSQVVSDGQVEDVLRDAGIYRPFAGVTEL